MENKQKQRKGPLSLINSMEQKIDESESLFENLSATTSYLVENANNLFLHIESYKVPKAEEQLQSFVISADFKKIITSIVQNYEDLHGNSLATDWQNTKEFEDHHNELMRQVQALKMISRKLSAIRNNFIELREEANNLGDNFFFESSGDSSV